MGDELFRAFEEGTKSCGIKFEDWTDKERNKLLIERREQERYISQLYDYTMQIKRAGGNISSVYSRVETWVNRYGSFVELGKSMACSDRKYRWILGQAEHCGSCLKLDGKVKRMSYWSENVLPRNGPNEKLECGGWRCQCSLVETNDAISKGPLPALP